MGMLTFSRDGGHRASGISWSRATHTPLPCILLKSLLASLKAGTVKARSRHTNFSNAISFITQHRSHISTYQWNPKLSDHGFTYADHMLHFVHKCGFFNLWYLNKSRCTTGTQQFHCHELPTEGSGEIATNIPETWHVHRCDGCKSNTVNVVINNVMQQHSLTLMVAATNGASSSSGSKLRPHWDKCCKMR